MYRYVEPVFLPAGTTVVARWTFDNSSGNPRNPNRPPKAVTFGQRTSDEMAELWFQVVPRNQADRDLLTRSLKLSLLPENIKGYEMMLRAEPDRADAARRRGAAVRTGGQCRRHGAALRRNCAHSTRFRPGAVQPRQRTADAGQA